MPASTRIITVSLNPAVDRVLEVPDFRIGAHQTGREIRRTPAGKGVNVSRVLAKLGAPCVATGFLGRDNRDEFRHVLADDRTADEFFPLPGRTRENVTITDPENNRETHIRNPGLKVDERNFQRLLTKLRLIAREGYFVLFCGSTPPGIGPDEFARLVDTCLETGARVAVDTSGPPLKAVADRKLWLLKPNAAELSELVGRDLPDRDAQLAAGRELAQRVSVVLLTSGAEGAYLLTRDQAVHGHVEIDAQEVRNTVGCGDVMLGAFVAGIDAGMDIRDAFAQTIAAATAAACHLVTAEFEAELFEQFKQRVELTDL
ncbi:MAG: 1-phosphofructokinase family hexose kinase [Phycisphaerae bacterium]